MHLKSLVGVLFTAIVGGCSPTSMSYVMDNFGSTPMVEYQHTAETSYRIFDKPTESRMMITGSMGAAFKQSMIGGNVKEPAGNYTAAAQGWLTAQGRKCIAQPAVVLIEPQFEVRYICS